MRQLRRRRMAAAVLSCAAMFLVVGCDNTIEPTEQLPPLEAASLDEDAASWRMLVLSSPSHVTVAAPAATTSDAYKTELDGIKSAQANLTESQRRSIEYWSGGGVLRWNQIMRELVAQFNLPPAPRPDGSYGGPDAENPFADPQFPFANPPYAVRAYSYVSVAQFEALKSAWYWKYQYNRPSPSRVDAGVSAMVPIGDLPAYPSEDAVLSGVTAELLKLLFPAAVEEITLRAAEQRNAAIWSGKATSSDVAAGLLLGKPSRPFLAHALPMMG